ncbi:PUA-like domain-containing protein [Dissophora ornata]|nr:PUA-like domain-containing protein [Dissophora ornata]
MASPSSFPTRSYRPLQCPTCKDLLRNPVTLPCGFTVCQSCLPPAQTINFQQQIRCPFRACTRSNLHLPDQLLIDVTLQKLTTALRTAVLQTNFPSEDPASPKSRRQPDSIFYGSASSDPAWGATLEGLCGPYESVGNKVSSQTAPPSVLYRNISSVIDTIRPKIQQEIECQVCFLVFHQPITTCCGHTLCKSCLITSLDHKPSCPLCRRQLPLYMYYHNQPPNKALVRFIQYLANRPNAKETEDVPLEEREIEPTLSMTPLFINSLVFPKMPCYLLVFEPRYRKMLRNVLRTESKLFGMVLPPRPRKHRDLEHTAWEPSMDYGTILKVLSCQLLSDGRALVETAGVVRFQVMTYSMMDGYYAATAIELIHDIPPEQELGLEKAILEAAAAAAAQENAENTRAVLGLQDLREKNLETLSRTQLMQILVAYVTYKQEQLGPLATQRLEREFGEMDVDDGQSFSFWVASVLSMVRSYQKYELLKVTSVRQRLLTVLGWIKDIEARRSMAACAIS